MSSIEYLDVTYPAWKSARTFFGGAGNTYYITESEGYVLVLVNFGASKSFVISCRLATGNSSRLADINDFETNIKPTAEVQNAVGDCVITALIGE